MYYRVNEFIEALDFNVLPAPMMAWLRQAEKERLVKKKVINGYVEFKFRLFKKKKAIAFLEEKYLNYSIKNNKKRVYKFNPM